MSLLHSRNSMEVHREVIMSGLQRPQGETALSDFTLVSASGREWKVHKSILFLYSDVLYRMSTSKDFAECQAGRAVLNDVGDSCINTMVDFFYNATSPRDAQETTEIMTRPPPSNLAGERACFYVNVWLLADMYNVAGLQQWAMKQHRDWLRWQNDLEWMGEVCDHLGQLDNLPTEIWEDMVEAVLYHFRGMKYAFEVASDFFEGRPKLAIAVASKVTARV